MITYNRSVVNKFVVMISRGDGCSLSSSATLPMIGASRLGIATGRGVDKARCTRWRQATAFRSAPRVRIVSGESSDKAPHFFRIFRLTSPGTCDSLL
jgi:hypothetical protein